MKEIKVILKDKDTLILEEDAKKGDLIKLNNLANIDLSNIEHLISEGRDKVYLSKLEEVNAQLRKELENSLIKKELELKLKYQEEISLLEQKRKALENEKQSQIESFNLRIKDLEKAYLEKEEKEKLKLALEMNQEISKLKQEISLLEQERINNKIKEELNIAQEVNRVKEKLENQIKEKDLEINEHINKIAYLERVKSSTTVKLIGEDLEEWCHHQMLSYMQNGFSNCTWVKDNKVIKEEDEKKGSKSDFIFKVYASDEHNENEELTSVCLEMKDENPSSTNKKKNSDYYKQLDNNRKKKNCKYAILVSQLESDNPHQDVIQRVIEYKDMYVVQPAYMITFLNMVTSLTVRFKELILKDTKEALALLSTKELIEEFESLKKSYLDNPLDSLNKKVNEIRKQSETIRKANLSIEENCEKIIESYINVINDKLNRFNVTRLAKKIEKIEE